MDCVVSFCWDGEFLAGKKFELLDNAGNVRVWGEMRWAGECADSIEWDSLRQNYVRWCDAAGRCPVLEISYTPERDAIILDKLNATHRVGVPLALVRERASFSIVIRAAKIELYADGKFCDAEWTLGDVPQGLRSSPSAQIPVKIEWHESVPVPVDNEVTHGSLSTRTLNYWTPPGYNRWIGDTVLFHDGQRVHLFYLIDRRHGESKAGTGGHEFAHASTSDLCNWQAHPLVVPNERRYEAIGTGSAAILNDKFYFFYGLHTSRVTDSVDSGDKTPLPSDFADLKAFPMGTAVAVSDDGIHFSKMDKLVHAAQNPSVCRLPNGQGWGLFAGYAANGFWKSDDCFRWHFVAPDPYPLNDNSPFHNTNECVVAFEWGGWHYLLCGRTGFWMARQFEGPYHGEGAVTPRWDIYDGLWVPSVCRLPDGRHILSGWIERKHGTWAGTHIWRELVQESDGALGMCWWDAAIPETGETRAAAWSAEGETVCLSAKSSCEVSDLPESYLLEIKISPASNGSDYALVFGAGKCACELRFSPSKKRVSWAARLDGSPAATIPSQEEIFASPAGKIPIWDGNSSPHLRFHGSDFCIEGVEGLDSDFNLRVIFWTEKKSDTIIIDAEIGRRRTLVTRRNALTHPDTLLLLAGNGAMTFSRPRVSPIHLPKKTRD